MDRNIYTATFSGEILGIQITMFTLLQ